MGKARLIVGLIYLPSLWVMISPMWGEGLGVGEGRE
jgi:hypothetical protein